jgi:hypothetical protein
VGKTTKEEYPMSDHKFQCLDFVDPCDPEWTGGANECDDDGWKYGQRELEAAIREEHESK